MTVVPPLVVVGASAGGVEALCRLLSLLPADLPAAVLVVMHVAPAAPNVLPRILARAGRLPAEEAVDGTRLVARRVYVAPSDQHLLVRDGHVVLVRGPRENGHRPALDPLFRSAAREHGADVVGVVLSGNLSDGTHGLAQVKRHGGMALVQDPLEALFDGMPRSAIAEVMVDEVLPIAGLATAIERFARASGAGAPSRAREVVMSGVATNGPRGPDGLPDDDAPDGNGDLLPLGDLLPGDGLTGDAVTDEVQLDGVGHVDAGPETNAALGGALAPYTCPECNGNLWEIGDGKPVRFRCRVGHSYDEPTLVHHKDTALEAALWTAVMALEENASLARQVAVRAGRHGRDYAAKRFTRRALMLDERARTVRAVLELLPPTTAPFEQEAHA